MFLLPRLDPRRRASVQLISSTIQRQCRPLSYPLPRYFAFVFHCGSGAHLQAPHRRHSGTDARRHFELLRLLVEPVSRRVFAIKELSHNDTLRLRSAIAAAELLPTSPRGIIALDNWSSSSTAASGVSHTSQFAVRHRNHKSHRRLCRDREPKTSSGGAARRTQIRQTDLGAGLPSGRRPGYHRRNSVSAITTTPPIIGRSVSPRAKPINTRVTRSHVDSRRQRAAGIGATVDAGARYGLSSAMT